MYFSLKFYQQYQIDLLSIFILKIKSSYIFNNFLFKIIEYSSSKKANNTQVVYENSSNFSVTLLKSGEPFGDVLIQGPFII